MDSNARQRGLSDRGWGAGDASLERLSVCRITSGALIVSPSRLMMISDAAAPALISAGAVCSVEPNLLIENDGRACDEGQVFRALVRMPSEEEVMVELRRSIVARLACLVLRIRGTAADPRVQQSSEGRYAGATTLVHDCQTTCIVSRRDAEVSIPLSARMDMDAFAKSCGTRDHPPH
jgi:hypothetical protein